MIWSYGEVLSLPFCTRIELAGFYGRQAAYPEALEACWQAFNISIDPSVRDDPYVQELIRRAQLLQENIEDLVPPEDMERIFSENMKRLDRDGNGFVHFSELREAQFDLSLSPECHRLIRHLLSKYFEIEASSNDEWGVDINGISLRDVEVYARRQNSNWKRMSKRTERPPGTNHVSLKRRRRRLSGIYHSPDSPPCWLGVQSAACLVKSAGVRRAVGGLQGCGLK